MLATWVAKSTGTLVNRETISKETSDLAGSKVWKLTRLAKSLELCILMKRGQKKTLNAWTTGRSASQQRIQSVKEECLSCEFWEAIQLWCLSGRASKPVVMLKKDGDRLE